MTWTTRPRSDFAGLAAIEAGTGPLVVLLHGVGLRSEAWNPLIDRLSTQYRVAAIDMPGHGESPMLGEPATVQDFSDALAQRFDAPALLIGHSMGAMIALDIAARYSNRVRGIAALNAVFERSEAAAKAVHARASRLDGAQAADPTDTLARWFGQAKTPERDACAQWLRAVDPWGYALAYRTFASASGPSRHALADMRCPALFMTGSEEPNSTPAMSQAMAGLAAHGRAVIVEGAAHMMPMTHADVVGETLESFAGEVWA